MPELTRVQTAVAAVIVFVVVFFGARALRPAPGAGAAPASVAAAATVDTTPQRAAKPTARRVVVHVAGAVRRPGVYRLPATARVDDAVRRAGGRTRGGDTNQVNLAARVVDGSQIVIPRRGAAVPAAVASADATGAAAAPSAPVDLNSATAEQLDTLDGVGPVTVRKILEYRTAHGGFKTVDELSQIPGIGPKRLAAIRPRVRV